MHITNSAFKTKNVGLRKIGSVLDESVTMMLISSLHKGWNVENELVGEWRAIYHGGMWNKLC